MTIEFKRAIREHQKSYPVQVVPLAIDLGLRVFRTDGLPDDVSGRIYRSRENGGSSGYAIDVNAKHSDVRRRFTIAHEIAHFVMHRPYIGDEMLDDYLYRSGLSNALERQANRMAADILMPIHLIENAKRKGLERPAQLAAAFQVSESAMAIRLGVPV